MRGRRVWIGILAGVVSVSAAIAQTSSPVLGSVSTPYAALQNTAPIMMAGHSYGKGQVAYGPVGTPLRLTGSSFGESGSVWFLSYKSGVVDLNVSPIQAVVTLWTPTEIATSVPAGATSGIVVVVSGSTESNGQPFLVTQGAYAGSCPVSTPISTLQIATTSLSDGTVNQSYSALLNATGGSGSYSWTLVSGTLPAGLSLSSSGTIAGTPTAAASTSKIVVQVTDTSSAQQTDATTLSITVNSYAEGTSSAALYSYSIVNTSGGSGYDAVGNVTAYTDSVNGTWSFGYDSLNRLISGTGSQANNPYPNICWSYDSFGNRTVQSQQLASCSSPSIAQASSTWVYGANNQVIGVMPPNSTTISPSPYTYDPAGNVTLDTVAGNQYLYDAEGRICAVANTAVQSLPTMVQYLYDAEGHRVAKGSIASWSCDTASNGFTATTVYVLGPGGEQLTELSKNSGTWRWVHTNVYAGGQQIATYDADATGQTTGKLYFHLSDWLGTRRQQTDYAGNPVLNFTGLPYGDGLSSIPVSTVDAEDATEHHFTAKERDTESENDYFGARYYASSMGRMLSPDPLGGSLANPQSLNKYAYALNNPVVNTDPTGMYVCEDSTDCNSDNDKKFAQRLADARNAAWNLSGADLLNAMNAINAYGEQGVDNGVNVRFDSSITDGNGNSMAGVTEVSGITNGENDSQNNNPTQQNINVTFNPDQLSGAGGAGLVAHEGSHVADGAAWVASGFSFAMNPTNMMTELKAYHVGSDITLGAYANDPRWDGTGLPPSYLYPGRNGSASRSVNDPWSNVQGLFRDFVKGNYSNVGSPAFSTTFVVPR